MENKLSLPIFEVPLDGSDFRGEYPAYPVPIEARKSLTDALQRKETHYVNVPGITPLREAIAAYLNDIGIDTPFERIVVTAGEQEARFLSLPALVQEGYKAAIPAVVSPGVQRVQAIRKRQAQVIPADPSNGLLPDLSAIEEVLKSGINLIYLESPSRLTGYCYDQEKVQRIAGLLEDYDAIAIWDQSTAPAVIGEYASLVTFAPERVIAFGTLWPGIGFDTWQLGYINAPTDYVQLFTKLKQAISICTSAPLQWAGVGASQAFNEKHVTLKSDMEAVRHEVLSSLLTDERLLVGRATNILAVDLGDTAPQALQRLEHAGMQVTDGAFYGAPGILRIVMKPNPETISVFRMLIEGA